MNNDQVKKLLLEVRPCKTEFIVFLSGKSSTKVNGLYKPDTREIILHNKNFKNDNQLAYTALHEYAHHLQAEAKGGILSPRAHNPEFWALFHELLEEAEAKGLYKNIFDSIPEFKALAARIKSEFLAENGKIMKEMGKVMIEAEELCREYGARFEDFIDRAVGMSRMTARTTMKISSWDVNPALGYDSMKVVAGIRDPERRESAERSLASGKSIDSVKLNLKTRIEDQDPREELQKERERLERTIENLKVRLKDVEEKIRAAEGDE
jgi:hypothetical protein